MTFEVKPLSTLVTYLQRGVSPKYADVGIPVVNQKCIRDGHLKFVDIKFQSSEKSFAPEKVLQEGDILVNSTGVGTLGRVARFTGVSKHAIADSHVTIVRPNSDFVNPGYLFYALRLSEPGIVEMAAGSTGQTELSRIALGGLSITIPGRPREEFISTLFTSIDTKIRLNEQLSKTLEEIAQTIFKSWFIDFDPVKAKMAGQKPVGMDAATAALFPDSMEDSELGFIPTAWAVRELGDVLLTIESGKRPKGGSQSSGVPSLGAESIRGLGEFDFSSTKFIPHVFYAGMPTGKVKPFDVLIYKDGAGAGSYVSMFGGNFPFAEYAINEHVFLLRANQIPQSYLYFWMNLDSQKRLMVELAQKSAQPGLNQKDMKSISTLVPSTEILNTFDNLMKPFIAQIMSNSAENQTLSKIRDALLPRLISGELQIPEEMLTS